MRPSPAALIAALLLAGSILVGPAGAATSPNALAKSTSRALNTYWDRLYALYETDYIAPKGGLRFYDKASRVQGCVLAKGTASYCATNKTIYVDRAFFRRLAREHGPAAAAVLAHQWGRFIQDDTGYLAWSRERGYHAGAQLQADCYAGMFLGYAERTKLIAQDRIETAAKVMLRVADPRAARDRRVDPAVVSGRLDWFGYGYRFGQIDICDSVYAMIYGY